MIDLDALSPAIRAAIIAFLVAFIVTPVVRAVSLKAGRVSRPEVSQGERWSRRTVALFGGIAIFLGFLVGSIGAMPHSDAARALLMGTAMVFLLGFLDDLKPLSPMLKLLGQVAAAGLLVHAGVIIEMLPWPWLNALVSVLWIVVLTNAFNLIDNMDGLAAGVAAISAFMVFGLADAGNNIEIQVLSLALAAACGAFLLFNFNPATIFMGDSGSMVLGYVLAGLSILGNWQHVSGLSMTLLAPVMIVLVPIFDTALVTATRSMNGRKISHGGTDHSSHRLVYLGLSEREAVLTLYGASILMGLVSLSLIRTSIWEAAAMLGVVGIVCGFAFWHLARVPVYDRSKTTGSVTVRQPINISHP